VVTQALRNGVDLSMYASGSAALDEGAISGADMTSSAALVKLMQALAYLPTRQIAGFMRRPIAGEVSIPRMKAGLA
jgi:L-asparaginase